MKTNNKNSKGHSKTKLEGAAIDITERKRAQEALRSSEQRYKLLFERNLAAVYRTSLDGTVLDCNESFVRLLGYDSREEIMATPVWKFYFHHSDRQRFLERLQEQGSLTNVEMCLRRKDGKPVWILENVSLIEGDMGQSPVVQGTSIDITERRRTEEAMRKAHEGLEIRVRERTAELTHINEALRAEVTERKRAEKALRESEERFRALFENAPVGIGLSTSDGQVVTCNNAMCQMTGYSEAELKRIHMEDTYQNPKDREMLLKRLQTEKEVSNLEIPRKRKDGTGYLVSATVNALSLGGESVLLTIAEDVTGRKRAEEALKKYRYHLEELVKERTVKLTKANQQLQREISERRRTEEALRESEERLKLILEGAELGTWDHNMKTGEIVRNRRWAEMLGYTLEEIDPDEDAWKDLIHPDDLPMVDRITADHKAGREPFFRCEHRMRTKSGEWKWILNCGKIIQWDSEGKPIRATGTHADITERKRAEEALRESEEKFRTIFESVPISMIMIDKDGIMVEVNAHQVHHVARGLTPREGYIGKSLITHPTIVNAGLSDTYRRLLKGESFDLKDVCFPSIQRGTEGYYFNIKGVSLFKEGEVIGAITVHEDITERKRAEEALRESEERYRIVSELTSDYVCKIKIDSENNMIMEMITDGFTRISGYKLDEVKTPQAWKKAFHPDDLEKLANFLKDIISQGRSETEARGLTKQGEIRWLYIFGRSEWSESEKRVGGVVLAAQDITERKRAEEELIRLSTAVKMTTDSIVISDLDGRIIDVNEATMKMYGTDNKKELIGKNSLDLITPEERQRAAEGMNELMEKGYLKTREYHVIIKDGSKIPVEMSTALMKDATGKPIGFVGISRDITERKRMERILERQRDIAVAISGARDLAGAVNRLFDNLLELEEFDCAGFYLLDKETGALDMILHRGLPTGFVEKVSYLSSESPYTKLVLEGKPIYQKTDNFPPAIREDLQSDGVLCVAAIPILHEGEVIADLNLASHTCDEISTSARHVLKSVSVQIGETIVRARMEEALRESEERFRIASQIASDVVYERDGQTGVATFYGDIDSHLGYEPGGYPRTMEGWRKHVHPEDLAWIDNQSIDQLEPGVPYSIEYRMRKKDGTYMTWLDRIMIIRDEKTGKPLKFIGAATNITERKRAEEVLRNYQLMVESANDVIFFKDMESRYVIANARTLEAFGLTREEVIGKNDLEIMSNKEEAKENIEDDQTVLKTGKPKEIFKQMTGSDGRKYWFHAIKVPQYDDKDDIIGLVGIARDMTEHKKAEEALKESEERYRNLFENAPIGIYRTTPDGRILMANPAIIRMLGYSSFEELASRNLEKEGYETPYPRSQFKQLIESIGEVNGLEAAWTKSDKSVIFVRENAKVFRDDKGAVLYYEGTAEDITERKRAEEALRESEERFRTAFNNANTGMCLVNPEGILTKVNDKMTEIFGYSKDELEGMSVNDIAHPEDKNISPDFIAKSIAGEIKSKEFEKRYRHKNGQIVWGLVSSSLVRDSESKPLYFVSQVQDITERKRAEGELRKFKTISEKAGYGVTIVDLEGNVIYNNKAYANMHGYTPDELIGKHLSIFHSKQHMATVNRLIEQLNREGSYVAEEVWHKRKNNTLFPTLMNGTLVKDEDGTPLFMAATAVDITERKRAEEALRESEQFNLSLLNNSPNPILVINPDTSVSYVNPALEKLTGFSSAEIIGKKAPFLWWTEETLKKTSKDLEKAMRKGANKVEEFFQKKNGERFWVEITSTPVKSNGDFKYYLANWVDITERKKAEEKLREANTIINRSPAVAFTWKNQEGWPVEFVSESVEKLFGYTAKEFTSRKISYADCVHPDDLKRVAGEVAAFSSEEGRKEFVHQPYRIKTKDGLEKVIHDWTFIVRDENGKIIHYKGIVEDITERKKAEDALREERNKLQAIVDSMGYGLTIQDRDYNVIYQNEALKNLVGDHLGEKCYWAYEFREKICDGCPVRMAWADGESHTAERKVVMPSGEILIVENTANPIRDAKGEIVACLEIIKNITERKKMEAQLIQAERLTAVGTLAYGIAHEFNNVLAGILGNAEFGMGNDNSQEVEECFRIIMENCDRARSITNSLLALSGQREPKKQRADVTDAVQTVLGLVERELEKQNIKLVKKFNPVPEIVCDLGELSEVCLNMITNARDAMRPKGGTLTIEVKKRGDNIEIIFTDTGGGIPDSIKGKIFEPFVTTKGALGKSEIPGTGLGLFLSYGIISRYQGKIEVTSKEGKGSRFTIKIPISKNQMEPVGIETEQEKPTVVPQNLNILLIDDEEPICDIVKKSLQTDGHFVVTSLSGKKGIELCKNKAFDLVLSDITMPDMDGVELISKVKKVDGKVKLIALTGHLAEEQLNRAKEAGADQILVKPFKKEDLYKVIGRALSI